MGFRITFTDNNVAEEGHHVYRSQTSMAGLTLAQMPAPVATLGPDVTAWEDGSVTQGETYYYRVGAFASSGTVELLSGEYEAVALEAAAPPPPRNGVTVALVVADTGHNATTNTKQALLDAGFLDANISLSLDTLAPPGADIIVICRACETQAKWNNIKPAWDAGTPVVFGAGALGFGAGGTLASTLANLTGTATVTDTQAMNEEFIVDNTPYITTPFDPGPLTVTGANSYGFALDNGAAYVGTLLATGDPDMSHTAGETTLVMIPAQTLDLVSNPTPARSVVWTNLYGGQSAYSADGAELLARCIDWCLTAN